MNYKITIAIPTYNSDKTILETLKSVLNQTYKDFQLLIVDNNSTDKTIDLVKKIKDSRIKIYKNKKNIGMFQNMNKCIKLCKTKYLKILSSDDLLEPTCIEKHLEIFEKYPSVNLLFNTNKVVNEQGNKLIVRRYFNKNKKINGGVLINLILKTGRNPIGEPSNVSFRMFPINKYKLNFNTSFKYVSDLDLWIRLLKYGDAFYISEILSSFRLHRTGATASLFKKAIQEHSKIISLYSDEFNLSLFDIIFVNIKLYINLLLKSFLIKFI